MSTKDVPKPDFVQVLARRRRSFQSWLNETFPMDVSVIDELKKEYTVTPEVESKIRSFIEASNAMIPSLIPTAEELSADELLQAEEEVEEEKALEEETGEGNVSEPSPKRRTKKVKAEQ